MERDFEGQLIRLNTGINKRLDPILLVLPVLFLVCLSISAKANEPLRIMPVGDSITKGLCSTNTNGYRKPLYINLINQGYNIDFVGSQADGDFADTDHEGHSGWHAAEDDTDDDILTNIYNWLMVNQPEIALLHIGTNDITWGDEDPNEVNDILNEIDRYETDSNESVTVILALIINRTPYSSKTTQFNNDLNDIALNRIANGDDIIVVDMETALDYSTDMYDNVHPNDNGYAKMAAVWFNVLYNLLSIAPTITSMPVTDANIGQLYNYDADANGYPDPNYTLITFPSGMTIDPDTGLIEWIPVTSGNYDVNVVAYNTVLPNDNQSFTITVPSTIKFDAASSDSNEAGTTLSWYHTIGSSNNRLLVVGLASKDSGVGDMVVNSVTYGSASMTLVTGSSITEGNNSKIKTELYYLLSPASGTNTITATYKGIVDRKCGGAISLSNVEQQPAETVATNSNKAVDNISTNITTATNCAVVIDIVGCGNSGTFTPATIDMMERFDINSIDSTGAGSSKSVESPGLTTMSWVYDSSANQIVHSLAVFAPTAPKISGYISEPDKTQIDGVLVSADNGGGYDTTDSNGFYELNVPFNWTGEIIPTKDGYMFNPLKQTYSNVTTDWLSQDYEDVIIYDVYPDAFIDWYDVMIISQNWLDDSGQNICDFDTDGDVNLKDFAMFANMWLWPD